MLYPKSFYSTYSTDYLLRVLDDVCASKSLRDHSSKPLLLSPRTVKSTHKNDQYLFFWGGRNRLELCLDNDTFDSYKLLTLTVGDEEFYLSDEYTVCGISICNGLICFFMYPDIIMLWNPTIYRLLTLHKPTLVVDELDGENTVTLCFDSLTDDYKVIRFICKEDVETVEPLQVEIFSLNNNSWRIISRIAPPFEIVGSSILILNGTLKWIGYHDTDRRWNATLDFDVNAEAFWIIDFSNILKFEYAFFNLAVYKETSIVICFHESFEKSMEVWMMKEYHNVESWTNIWRNDPSHQTLLRTLPVEHSRRVIGLLNNGQVLWEVLFWARKPDGHYKAIIAIDLESGIMKNSAVVLGTYYSEDVRYFEENLVLLDNGSALRTARRQ